LIHNYSDELKAKVLIYPIDEIFAEKLRALFERTRPRDIYDIVNLWDKVDRLSVPKLFLEKCDFKEVNPDVKILMDRKDDFKHAWEASLQHQLKIVPDFEGTFTKILEILKTHI
jgi:predicted nucleotidyltransferase component of viral defense system